MTSRSHLAAIVLAAGDSTRMGLPKQLLKFGPTTLLGHVIERVEESAVEGVVVVTGRLDDELREKVNLNRARWVQNPDPDRGTIESLRVGAAAVPDAERLLVVLGDSVTPDLDEVIATMLNTASTNEGSFMAGYAGGRRAHPYLIERELLDRTRDLTGDRHLFTLIDGVADLAHIAAPVDVNTWDDYREACRRFGYEPESSSGNPPSA